MQVNRVGSSAAAALMGWDMARAYTNLNAAQERVSSGKRINRPSDDPTDTAAALNYRSEVRRNEQYAANATDASGRLQLTDTVLMSVQEQLAHVRERGIQALNGAYDQATRDSLAQDIESSRAHLVQLANTTYQSRPLFAGTAGVDVVPYDSTGAYAGDNGAVRRTLADGVTLKVNVTGPDVFGGRNPTEPLQGDAFQVLQQLSAAIRSGDKTAMTAALGALDPVASRVSAVQTNVGGITTQVNDTVVRNESLVQDIRERLTKVEDVDIAQAIVELRSREAAYQIALGVTGRAIQPSLLDFLR